MNTKENLNINKIAIVGKSPLFPVVTDMKSFWPALIALNGLLPDLATAAWPFSDLLSEERLGKLKGYFMESGLLSGGKLPEGGFEIPSEILQIDEVIPVLALFLAKQALNNTVSFSAKKIDNKKINVGLYSFADSPGATSKTFDPVRKKMLHTISEEYGLSEHDNIPQLAGAVDTLKFAFEQLQSDNTDLAIVGGVNSVNATLSFIESMPTNKSVQSSELKFVEGMGFVTLRRLEDAERDSDTIYAVISNVDDNAVSFVAPELGMQKPIEISRQMPASFSEFMRSEMGLYPSPFTNLGRLSQAKKEEVLENSRYVYGASFSKVGIDKTSFVKSEFEASSWMPSKLAEIYGSDSASPDLLSRMVCSEHFSQFARLNPADIDYNNLGNRCSNLPYNPVSVSIQETEGQLVAEGSIEEALSWKMLRDSWVKNTGSHRFFHDLLGILSGTFINRIVFKSPAKLKAVMSQPVIYMANHQVGIESPLFMALSNAMSGVPIQAVAKPDHVNTWLAFLMAFAEDSLGADHPFKLAYFDKAKPLELIEFLKTKESREASLLVHVEGTRDSRAGQPVEKLSSVFIDMAITNNTPIVPVRFVGGLPIGKDADKLDFPYQGGRQDYFFGEPIFPEDLKKLFYGQRPKFIIEKINNLGPLNDEDFPGLPIKKFVEKQSFLINTLGMPTMQAMLFAMLGMIDDPCNETALLIEAAKSGKIASSGAGMPPALQKFMKHLSSKK